MIVQSDQPGYLERIEEQLHPDLVDYLDEDGGLSGGPALRSPLVWDIMLVCLTDEQRAELGEENAQLMDGVLRANRAYEYKKEHLEESLRQKDFNSALWIIERPYRIIYLSEWWDERRFNKKQFRSLLADAWQDTEMPYQYGDLPLRLFREAGYVTDDPLGRALPTGTYTLYRGAAPEYKKGISWTRSIGKAAWFAERFDTEKRGKVWTVDVDRSQILGHIMGRGEHEVIVDTATLLNEDIKELE